MMKKLFISLLAVSLLLSFSYTTASAKAIGLKAGYLQPKDDLKDYDDQWAFGIYFDMGTFLINNLDFRPGLDYFTLENSDRTLADVWGIHFDWYWHFLDKGSIAPFIGFGPVLNYYDYEDDNTSNEDSDAGVDLFLGLDIKIGSTPLSLMIEGRYKFLDIAARDQTAMALNIGIAYNF
jgi:hypothetical protein